MDRHEQILEAAAKRFAHYGFRRTVVDDVARDAGVAKGSVYLHVQNKEDLFRQVIRREQELMNVAALEAIANHPEPRAAIHSLVIRLLAWMEERPLMGRLMTGDPELGLGGELARSIEESCHEQPKALFETIAIPLVKGMQSGEFRPDMKIEAAVTVVISIFHIHLHNKQQRFIDMDTEAFTTELLRVLFEGILICERGTND